MTNRHYSVRPTGLPIDAVAEEISAALSAGGAVITAEPGAGKSSVVPLLAADQVEGLIYLCEPRRVAARATAQRLADLTGKPLGSGYIGLVMRGEHARSANNKIVVMTEGVFTQIMSEDPELPGVGSVIFDEFHERSLNADLGLAMSIESRDALRPDLSVSVMSATIDAPPIAALLGGAPIISAEGRTFPIETRSFPRPTARQWAYEVARHTATAFAEVDGSVLVFVPGRREIRNVIGELSALGLQGEPLSGGTDARGQRRLLAANTERRIIVATAVAETSLTIPNVNAVVDGGLARRAAYDQKTGLGRLETGYVTRFAADQRRGRAGRLSPGLCLRLWSAEDHRHLDEAPLPEVLSGDPLELGFNLARWGDPFAHSLPLLDTPPKHRLDAAYERLADLGLTSIEGSLTELGSLATKLGLHPRAAALVARASTADELHLAAQVAMVTGSDQWPQNDDFEAEVKQTRRSHEREVKRLLKRLSQLEKRLSPGPTRADGSDTLALLCAKSWPDRLALVRSDDPSRYLLATGSEVKLRRSSTLTGSEALVIVDADADQTSGFVSRAIPLSRDDLIAAVESLTTTTDVVTWDGELGRVRAERVTSYGALIFRRQPSKHAPPVLAEKEVLSALRRSNLDLLSWSTKATETRARLAWLHDQAPDDWPDVRTSELVDRLAEWITLDGRHSAGALQQIDVGSSLLALLTWQQRQQFDKLAPTSLDTPKGQSVRVTYVSGEPVWAVRLQWLLGLDQQPVAGPHQTPITIELLSPASRPVQRTQDLPGFWRGSYQGVRSDLRGRYPKHDWPEDPLAGRSG